MDEIWRTPAVQQDVAKAIDSEIHSIIEECHDNAKKIISEHMEVLHAVPSSSREGKSSSG